MDSISTPATDPAYSAYLRAAGVQESDIVGQQVLRTDQLQRQKSRRGLDFADKLQQGLEDVDKQALDRGMFNSGRRLVEAQRVQDRSQRAQSEYNTSIDDDITNLDFNAARDIAALRRQTADRTASSYGDPARYDPGYGGL